MSELLNPGDYDEDEGYDDPDDYDDRLMPPVCEEPDWDEIEYEKHLDTVHGGQPCDCPVPDEAEIWARWEAREAAHRAEAHGGGQCDCKPPF